MMMMLFCIHSAIVQNEMKKKSIYIYIYQKKKKEREYSKLELKDAVKYHK